MRAALSALWCYVRFAAACVLIALGLLAIIPVAALFALAWSCWPYGEPWRLVRDPYGLAGDKAPNRQPGAVATPRAATVGQVRAQRDGWQN